MSSPYFSAGLNARVVALQIPLAMVPITKARAKATASKILGLKGFASSRSLDLTASAALGKQTEGFSHRWNSRPILSSIEMSL